VDFSDRGALLVTRFGVPLLLLLFYISAVRHFNATPDETFLTALHARVFVHGPGIAPPPVPVAGTPSPGWLVLLAAGEALGVDVLLTAKAFSLLFTCVALLGLFLLGVEVLSDRLLAFGVMIVAGAQAWLLEAAASGAAAGAALAGVIFSLFFWQRREAVLAVFFASMATLIFWEACMLVCAQILAVTFRERTRGEGGHAGPVLAAVAAVVIGPWLVYALLRGLHPLPVLLHGPLRTMPGTWDLLAFGVAGVFTLAWIVLAAVLRAWADMIANAALIFWIVWLAVLIPLQGTGMALQLFPLLVLVAVPGCLALLAFTLRRRAGFGAALLPVALLLLLAQAGYLMDHRRGLLGAEEDLNSLATAAVYLRTVVPEGSAVASDRPWVVWFFAGRPVLPLPVPDTAVAVVAACDSLPGYHRASRAGANPADVFSAASGRYSVWLHNREGTP
jgi:hypothetical protein